MSCIECIWLSIQAAHFPAHAYIHPTHTIIIVWKFLYAFSCCAINQGNKSSFYAAIIYYLLTGEQSGISHLWNQVTCRCVGSMLIAAAVLIFLVALISFVWLHYNDAENEAYTGQYQDSQNDASPFTGMYAIYIFRTIMGFYVSIIVQFVYIYTYIVYSSKVQYK